MKSLTAAAIAAGCVGAFYGAGRIMYSIALDPKAKKPSNCDPGKNSAPFDPESFMNREWLKRPSIGGVIIRSYDGLALHALIDDSVKDRFVIICHGYTGDSVGMSYFAAKFTELGFGCLIPDARGHGESEGDYIGMGWHERRDIVKWISYLNRKYDKPDIVLFGISMGAATVMMTSGEKLPRNVKAIIEDCGYSSIYDEFRYEVKALFHLPPEPILTSASLVTALKAGYDFKKEGSCVEQVAKCVTPMLFIHGGSDTFVPTEMVDKVYEAAVCKKKKIVFPGAGHAESALKYPEKYWKYVKKFLSRYIKEL